MKARHGRHGVPPIYDKTVSEILSANFNSGSAAMMVMPTVSGSVYRISVWKAVTRAATTSWTMPWLTIGWMDDNSITRSFTLLVANSTNTATKWEQGTLTIITNASTAVTATSASYASSGATSMEYALAIVLKQVV